MPCDEDQRSRLSVATYNICALAHPLVAPPLAVLVGLLFGLDLADRASDVPLDALGLAGRRRMARHARYIRDSGADIVMLQEISGKAVLDEIARGLDGEYEVCYSACAPSAVAVCLWLASSLTFATASFALLEGVATLLLGPQRLAALFVGRLVRWVLVAAATAWRWRHSMLTQYLLGSVGGQLAFLRRRACASCGPLVLDGFTPFDEAFVAMGAAAARAAAIDASAARSRDDEADGGGAAPRWLQAFFAVRPRGVLRVRAPLEAATPHGAAASGELVLMNTHMPHGALMITDGH